MKRKKEKRPSGLGYIFLTLVTLAIGVCFFAFGNRALETLALVIGIVVLLSGVIFAVFTLSNKRRGLGFGVRIAVSAAMIASGICTVILRDPAIEVLTNVFALLTVVDGSFKLNTAVLCRMRRSRSYACFTALSVLTIACGFLAITYVSHSYMLGAGMLMDALANFVSAFYVPKMLKALTFSVKEETAEEKKEKE